MTDYQRGEYKTVSTDMTSQELNEVGLAGWELVTVVQTAGEFHNRAFFRHIFKRPRLRETERMMEES